MFTLVSRTPINGLEQFFIYQIPFLMPALVALWAIVCLPVHAAHKYRKGWGSTPSHARKIVMLLSVHALRLISRAGKRGFSGVLYNL